MKITKDKTVKFECVATKISGEELEKLKISEASIQENAKSVFGGEMPDHPSIMLFKGALANAGKINKNGHGVTIADLVKFYKKFTNMPVNVEHSRSQNVGFIIDSHLTKHNSEEKLSKKAALESTEPIDVSIMFAVWPHVDPNLSTILAEVSNPENPSWGLIRLSWECAYSAYNLLVGSYDTFSGEIIEDESQITEMEKYLIDNGGTGKTEDGKPVSMLLADGDSILPLGCGLVLHPAADVGNLVQVKGSIEIEQNAALTTFTNPSIKNDLEKVNQENEKVSKIENEDLFNVNTKIKEDNEELNEKPCIIKQNNEKNEIFCSHQQNQTVKRPNMKITSVNDITDEVLANKEVTASEIGRFIIEELKKESEKWREEVEAKKTESIKAQEAADAALKEVDSIKLNLESVTKELEEIKSAQVAAKAEYDFNNRMTVLNDEFELSDEDREIVANQIKALDEEGFVSWKKSFDIIAKQKSKEFIKANTKETKVTEVKASTEEVKEEVVLDPLEQVKLAMVPVPGAVKLSEDAIAAYRDGFTVGKGIKIS